MIYFVSDAHLGSLLHNDPRAQEQKLVRWLDMVRHDATTIYLLGDIFDFWFEYKSVVPKGYVRLLGKLAELTDAGIDIHFLIGNHDLWTFGYLEKEVGLKVHYKPFIAEHFGKKLFLAHGDGLAGGDQAFKLLRSIFHSKMLQQLFMLVPPRIGQWLGYNWSKSNREGILHADNSYKGEVNEPIVQFAKTFLRQNSSVNYLIFGHRHLDLKLQLTKTSELILLGDFVSIFSYGKFDGFTFSLEYFEV